MKRQNVNRACGLRQSMAKAEQKLWYHLRNRHLSATNSAASTK